MIKYKLINHFTKKTKYTVEIDCDENEKESVKKRLAVLKLYRDGVRDFMRLDLSKADLSHACFRDADFSYADFRDTNLRCVDFRHARLNGNDFSGSKSL